MTAFKVGHMPALNCYICHALHELSSRLSMHASDHPCLAGLTCPIYGCFVLVHYKSFCHVQGSRSATLWEVVQALEWAHF